MRKLRIECPDGDPRGAKFTDAETGEPFPYGVKAITVRMDAATMTSTV